MKRLIVLVSVLAMTLLGFVAVGLPAQGSIPPGTNGKIVVGQVFPNYGFTINPDGSDEHQIGPQGSTTCNTWSPDSSKVLCNLWSEESVQPATANPDGSDFTLLNPNLPLDLFCLSWSPDGTRLLCHSEGIANPADAGLYTVRSSDAGDLVRVTTTPPDHFDDGYGYSPDGSRILFGRFDSSGRGVLFSVTPDGGGAVQLSPPNLGVIDLGFFDRDGAAPGHAVGAWCHLRPVVAERWSDRLWQLLRPRGGGYSCPRGVGCSSGRNRAQGGHQPNWR